MQVVWATVTEDGDPVTQEQVWSLFTNPLPELDGHLMDDEPTMIALYADDGEEQGWLFSTSRSITGRWTIRNGKMDLFQQVTSDVLLNSSGVIPLSVYPPWIENVLVVSE